MGEQNYLHSAITLLYSHSLDNPGLEVLKMFTNSIDWRSVRFLVILAMPVLAGLCKVLS